ncbi:MAG: hypothetical protein P8Z81_01930 [Deinococcales bacterium]
MRRLLKAEGRASERLAEAEAHAREQLEQAAVDARARREQAAARAATEREETLADARADAEAEAVARVDAERARWQGLAAAAGKHLDAAVALVVGWVCADEGVGEAP